MLLLTLYNFFILSRLTFNRAVAGPWFYCPWALTARSRYGAGGVWTVPPIMPGRMLFNSPVGARAPGRQWQLDMASTRVASSLPKSWARLGITTDLSFMRGSNYYHAPYLLSRLRITLPSWLRRSLAFCFRPSLPCFKIYRYTYYIVQVKASLQMQESGHDIMEENFEILQRESITYIRDLYLRVYNINSI